MPDPATHGASTTQPTVTRKGLARHVADAEAALKQKLEELKAAFAERERLTQRYAIIWQALPPTAL